MSYKCPICADPMKVGETYSFDIDMGTCHAKCLEGSPAVDLRTGEPLDGEPSVYVWTERDAADYEDDVPTNEEGATIQ